MQVSSTDYQKVVAPEQGAKILERLMEGATKLSCSAFGEAIAEQM